MKSGILVRAGAGLIIAAAMPGIALAQAAWAPGSEIVGQPIQVTTNGTTNTIYLDQGGAARLITPAGNTLCWSPLVTTTSPGLTLVPTSMRSTVSGWRVPSNVLEVPT